MVKYVQYALDPLKEEVMRTVLKIALFAFGFSACVNGLIIGFATAPGYPSSLPREVGWTIFWKSTLLGGATIFLIACMAWLRGEKSET